MLNLLASFFAGLFFCNAIPHLVAGLQGQPFPSPFATPRGVGDSSPLINFLWGTLNAVIAFGLAVVAAPLSGPAGLAALVGFLLCGWRLSVHFGRVMESRKS